MLLHAGMSQKFWAEAVLHAVELYNRTGTRVLSGRSPYELYHGRKPSLSGFRIFRCVTFAHVHKKQRKHKLSNQAKQCLLLRHYDSIYHLWDPNTRKAIVIKHVRVDESKYLRTEIAPLGEVETTAASYSYSEENCNDRNVNNSNHISLEESNPGESDRRYPLRTRKAVNRFIAGAARAIDSTDSPTLASAKNAHEKEHWMRAIKEELASLQKNDTWELVPRPPGKNIVKCKFVLRKKRNPDGTISKFKARLVICGNMDFDFVDESFAPVVSFSIVRLLLSYASARNYYVHHIDVSNAFLHGNLDREVYMERPKFLDKSPEHYFCRLLKSLYGLREAPLIWYRLLGAKFTEIGLEKTQAAPCVFRRGSMLCFAMWMTLLSWGVT